jgi:hypothetical protein
MIRNIFIVRTSGKEGWRNSNDNFTEESCKNNTATIRYKGNSQLCEKSISTKARILISKTKQ